MLCSTFYQNRLSRVPTISVSNNFSSIDHYGICISTPSLGPFSSYFTPVIIIDDGVIIVIVIVIVIGVVIGVVST